MRQQSGVERARDSFSIFLNFEDALQGFAGRQDQYFRTTHLQATESTTFEKDLSGQELITDSYQTYIHDELFIINAAHF